jgi:hypothetical protein
MSNGRKQMMLDLEIDSTEHVVNKITHFKGAEVATVPYLEFSPVDCLVGVVDCWSGVFHGFFSVMIWK